MRILYPLGIIYISLALTSCSTVEQPCPVCQQKNSKPQQTALATSPKNPLKVAFYTHTKPPVPYKVIGDESISKFNLGGNKRQEANIRDGMRELAAAMGGDAIINIKHDSKSISGTIVAY